jgi:hypothetical protein
MQTGQTTFVVTLCAESGAGAVRSLRALLKIAGRRLGLRCIEAHQEYPSRKPAQSAAGNPRAPITKDRRKRQMDISKYLSTVFLKAGDLASSPRRVVIADVVDGKYDKPDVHFQDGTCLSLNVTNLKALAAAYGTQTADWAGLEIELYVGPVKFNGENQDSVLVRPVSPAIPFDQRTPPPKPKLRPGGAVTSMDDEIPF